jgi:hypothetical protein
MQLENRKYGYLPASAFTRSQRIVIDDDGFYFKTRENGLMGPFHTEAGACFEMHRYVLAIEIENDLKSRHYQKLA